MKRINKPVTQIIPDTKVILNEYGLCSSCIERLFANTSTFSSRKKLENATRMPGKKTTPKCYICRNVMSNLNTYVSKMLYSSSNFEFSSFLVGAILKPSILDRDDQIRSKFRLKGIDSIKADITKELGKRFSRKTKTQVDYISPDVTFTVNFKKGGCEVRARPIFLSG
ncbi:MAG: pseudouridine synthase, partial [Nitrosopumilaceae archaeon]